MVLLREKQVGHDLDTAKVVPFQSNRIPLMVQNDYAKKN